MRPLFRRRRPIRNAVRMLLGIDPSRNARFRTRAWARGQASPDTPQASQMARSAFVSPTDDPSAPTPPYSIEPETEEQSPLKPMAQAVQPTSDAMAVASETDLDALAAPLGGMRMVDAAPAVVTTSGSGSSRLYASLPDATPRPATTEVALPQPAPMQKAVYAAKKTPPATPAPQPPVAKQAPSGTQHAQQRATAPMSEADKMRVEAQGFADQAAQLQKVFQQREAQWVAGSRSDADRMALESMADEIQNLRNQSTYLRSQANALSLQEQAFAFQREKFAAEQAQPQDNLKGNRRMFTESVQEYGIGPTVEDALLGWRESLQVPPDIKTEEAQRQVFTQNALSAAYAQGLRSRQPPVKGDYFTTTLANLAYKRFPNDPKARKAMVGSVVGAGLVMSRVKGGNPTIGITLTDSVARMVEELIAEMR